MIAADAFHIRIHKTDSKISKIHLQNTNDGRDEIRRTINSGIQLKEPVTVAERSKACTVFARSEAGTVGSNPTQGMHV
jgi:hypothetical protein